jgi:hypothetical protein
MKLSVQFNHKAKVIKTEDDIKVGMRTEADGSRIAVRAGKIINRWAHPETQQRKNGVPNTPEKKLNEFRMASAEAVAKKQRAARAHRKPATARAPAP